MFLGILLCLCFGSVQTQFGADMLQRTVFAAQRRSRDSHGSRSSTTPETSPRESQPRSELVAGSEISAPPEGTTLLVVSLTMTKLMKGIVLIAYVLGVSGVCLCGCVGGAGNIIVSGNEFQVRLFGMSSASNKHLAIRVGSYQVLLPFSSLEHLRGEIEI